MDELTNMREFRLNAALSALSLCATPLFAQALDDESSVRSFWCSLADSGIHYEGEYQGGALDNDDRRPQIITVPMTERESIVFEDFSEDGRYYYYVKNRAEDQSKYVLHGVFDLQLLKLSTSSSWFLTDDDGLSRAVSQSNVWACALRDGESSSISD